MALTSKVIAEINSCNYLFVQELCEPEENSLRVIVEEADPRPEAFTLEIAGTKIEGLHRIESDPEKSRLFEITWELYVAYSVLNESYSHLDSYEVFEGSKFRLYSKSRFLDYVNTATIATEAYPGPMQHIALVCESHVIDVISTQEPQVRRLRPA